jgi:hypothetical protein
MLKKYQIFKLCINKWGCLIKKCNLAENFLKVF